MKKYRVLAAVFSYRASALARLFPRARRPPSVDGSIPPRQVQACQRRESSFIQSEMSPTLHSLHADESADRFVQLRRVVADAVLENRFDFPDVRNCFGRIACDHHQVGG